MLLHFLAGIREFFEDKVWEAATDFFPGKFLALPDVNERLIRLGPLPDDGDCLACERFERRPGPDQVFGRLLEADYREPRFFIEMARRAQDLQNGPALFEGERVERMLHCLGGERQR